MISSKYLVREVDKAMAALVVLCSEHVGLNLIDIDGWNPGIRINDGDPDFRRVNTVQFEFLLLKVLETPGYIACFIALLVLP